MAETDHPHLDTVREQARNAALAGNAALALAHFRSLLELAPEDVEALNYVAMADLASGHVKRACERLERARDASPGDRASRKNLGIARLYAGTPAEAHEVLAPLLDEDPDFFVARLYLGLALERLGKAELAATEYMKAISSAQQQGQWTSTATTPAGLRAGVQHAMDVARRSHRQLVGSLLAPLVSRFGRSSMARVERCLAGYLGDLRLTPADPRQKPQFLYFPGLPETPVLDRGLFPWYGEMEAATAAITRELRAVLDDRPQFEPFLGEPPPGMESSYLGPSDDSATPRWDAFFFYRHGRRFDGNADRCPQTVRALDRAPTVRIQGHAPESLFSVLGPGSHIKPHHGVTNTRVVTHLPLIVPADCRLRVADHVHAWEPGRCFTFDDTFEHEAWNRSAQTRVILLFDVWNPHLAAEEREALGALIARLDGSAEEGRAPPS